jgi:2-polyprenyl-6-hydroxyphenyl methylase/3-demethylubiquinone-9 3-methyltransferase
VFAAAAMAPQEFKTLVRHLLAGRPLDYLRLWTRSGDRGMQRWRDIVDWVGGYPYEVATPDAVFDFCTARGFALKGLKCGGVGLGCNEFVFERS